jgi:hypothetical protein
MYKEVSCLDIPFGRIVYGRIVATNVLYQRRLQRLGRFVVIDLVAESFCHRKFWLSESFVADILLTRFLVTGHFRP